MFKKILIILSLFSLTALQAEVFVPGTDYTVVNITAPKQNPIQVIEFFNYGCPWCALAEPTVEVWKAGLPSNVNFQRVPLTFESGWDTYAKAYYLARALNIEPKITHDLFIAIHGQNDMQDNDLSSMSSITTFFAAHGVSAATVQQAFNSPTMASNLQQGPAMMQQYNVNAIPTFVVCSRYTVTLGQGQAPGQDPKLAPARMMAVVNYLIKQC
jgi:thiol:disulfide interchange protein DsbA